MTRTSGQIEAERIRKRSEIVITDFSSCYFCKSTGLTESDKFCPNCAFPQRGTQQEMQKFMRSYKEKQFRLEDQQTSIKKARNILFILSGLNLVIGLVVGLVINNDIGVLIVSVIACLIYLGLGFWCMKNPFPAILSGFFVFVIMQVMNAVADPHTIYQGIIWKVIIISAFVYGYKAALKANRLEKELQEMKKAENFNQGSE